MITHTKLHFSFAAFVLLALCFQSCESLVDTDPSAFCAPEFKSCSSAHVDNSVFVNLKAELDYQDAKSITKSGFVYGYDASSLSETILMDNTSRDMHATVESKKYGGTLYCQAYAVGPRGQRITSSKSEYRIPSYDNFVSLTTPVVKSTTSSSITVSSRVTAADGISIVERGICYSSNQVPTIQDNVVKAASSGESFEATISNLSQRQSLQIVPYSKDSDGNVAYGSPLTASTATVNVESVMLNVTSIAIKEGEFASLSATIYPFDAYNKAVVWSSSNTSVATVDSNGKVTGVKAGSVTITVTTEDGGKTASCGVTVLFVATTDLSSSGTANCYIVSESGKYCTVQSASPFVVSQNNSANRMQSQACLCSAAGAAP